MQKPLFEITQIVYHILPESRKGVIINMKYDYASGKHEYQVAFDEASVSNWYWEYELSESKRY